MSETSESHRPHVLLLLLLSLDLKPRASPSLEEDEGFSDWTQRREMRRQQRLQELSQGGEEEEDEEEVTIKKTAPVKTVQAPVTSSSRLQRHEREELDRMEMERRKEQKEEEIRDERMRREKEKQEEEKKREEEAARRKEVQRPHTEVKVPLWKKLIKFETK